jgi:hypothetical protein
MAMSLTIDDPPSVRACAPCGRPLAWLYSARTEKWVAFVTEPLDVRLLRVHECPQHPWDRSPPAWREVEAQPAEVIHAGAALAREALATTKDQQGGENNVR